MAKILVVDENKDARDFITQFFGERNFEVFTAINPDDIFLTIKKDRPDIVLLDIKTKDKSRIELLKQITKKSRKTKVVVVASMNDIEIMDEAKRWGAAAYLIKPIMLSELMDAVLKNFGRQHRFFALKRIS